MKTLLTTTALVLALGLPAASFSQTAVPADTAATATAGTTTPATNGFLAMRAMNQMLATDLIGHDVYARRTPMEMSAAGAKPMTGTAMATMTSADLDGMDNVGQINDLVLSNDGAVIAVVIGVGGFLGVGERDVAVTMNEVSFAANADKPKDIYIVVNTSGDMLKTSPAFDRVGLANGDAAAMPPVATDQTAEAGGVSDRAMLTAPSMKRDGYNLVKVSDVSIDMLIGKNVYGTDDKSVGTVDDVTVDTAGAVQKVIIDFGGFLGMGTTKVALNFDELTILTNAGNADIRVYVDATKDQIKAMPVYTPSK